MADPDDSILGYGINKRQFLQGVGGDVVINGGSVTPAITFVRLLGERMLKFA